MTPSFRILLLRPDKAGDALKSLPAVRALRAQWPSAEIHVLGSTHNQSIWETEPGIQAWVLPKNWEALSASGLEEWKNEEAFPSFTHTISLLCDHSEPVSRLAALWNAQATPLSNPAGKSEEKNIAALVGQALEFSLDLTGIKRAPLLHPEDVQEADRRLGEKTQEWVGLCPLAGDNVRTPNLTRWRHFVSLLTRVKPHTHFFLFGAPSDAAALTTIAGSAPRLSLQHPSSFRALGAYLLKMDHVVAVDSGPLHLAHALGCPTVGFMSGGDKARWCADLSPQQRVLRRGLVDRFASSPEMLAFYLWARP